MTQAVNKLNKRLLSPLRGWDGLSAAPQLQVRPKAGRYVSEFPKKSRHLIPT